MGFFTFVVLPILLYTESYLCVDLFLPMNWVNYHTFFCAASETAADMANVNLANPSTPWRSYAPTKDIYATDPNDTASANHLQNVEVYMDSFVGMTQGDLDQQERVTETFLRAIEEMFPSFPEEIKDFISLKKALQGNESWIPVKEILGWILNTQKRHTSTPRKRRLDLQESLDISSN